MEKICGIYQIRNLKDNKIYVGSSVNIQFRFYEHKRFLKLNKHCNNHLQNAWNKYGESSFVFEIIELCDKALLKEHEQSLMDKEGLPDCTKGYNIAPYADLPPMTEETKRKIGLANKGKTPWIKGKSHSIETKNKMSEWHKSNPTMQGRSGSLSPRFNVEVPEETRNKMRLAKLGKFNNHSSKSVIQLNENGIIENYFPSAREAQRQTGVDAKNIAACLKNKRKKAGGFLWQYESKNNEILP